MKGYVIKEKGKNNYYCGSLLDCKFSGIHGTKIYKSNKFSGFYGAKVYKKYKSALKALESLKPFNYELSIYEVEVTLKNLEVKGE